MFRRLTDSGADEVRLTLDGKQVAVPAGNTVAAVLLAENFGHFRTTPVSGALRAPYCMMGVCFECLVVIDGVPNQQACMIEARDGMRIERQLGPRAPGPPGSGAIGEQE